MGSGGRDGGQIPHFDEQVNGNATEAVGAKVPRQQRACETCRHLKIRCIFDPKSSDSSCVKCTKLNHSCVVRQYYRKKRTKKADSRVTDLERKMEALAASLEAQRRLHSSLHKNGSQPPGFGGLQDTPPSSVETDDASVSTGPSVDEANPVCPAQFEPFAEYESEIQKFHAPAEAESFVDVIDRGILDAETAYKIFYQHHQVSSLHLPFVVFPLDVKAENVRRRKPNLFLAVLAVTAGLVRPDLEVVLVQENFKNIAQKTIVEGKASLELVQTLLLTAVYVPPSAPNEGRNFTYITHLAATMAMDIELGRKPLLDQWRDSLAEFCPMPPIPKADAVEPRRTWLGCWYVSSMMATALQRPPIHRWNSYNEECLRILETAPDAAPTDAWICHAVRCQRIIEDVQREFGLDGIHPTASLAASKTAFQLRAFDNQVADWRATATNKMPQDLVNLMEALASLYIHEISLQQGLKTNEESSSPSTNYRTESEAAQDPPFQHAIGTAQASSLISCLEAAHKVFDIFFSFSEDTIRTIPIIIYVRVLLCTILLARIDIVVNNTQKFPIFRVEDVRASEYLSRFQDLLRKASKHSPSRATICFLFVVTKLGQWHAKVTKKQETNNATRIGEPSETRGSLPPISDNSDTLISDGTEDMEIPTSFATNLPQQNFGDDFELMDWGAEASMDSMMEGMGWGWMTSGFNFNPGLWAGPMTG